VPRKSRRRLVSKYEEVDRASRERELRELQRELRAAWREKSKEDEEYVSDEGRTAYEG
jgi:hypothetical protein